MFRASSRAEVAGQSAPSTLRLSGRTLHSVYLVPMQMSPPAEPHADRENVASPDDAPDGARTRSAQRSRTFASRRSTSTPASAVTRAGLEHAPPERHVS